MDFKSHFNLNLDANIEQYFKFGGTLNKAKKAPARDGAFKNLSHFL
jgi:hypothetical protein